MSEPIKKQKQKNTESYSPKTPILANMMENLYSEKISETITPDNIINTSTTKKVLNFDIRYNSLSALTFIQRFAAVYMFLEDIDGFGEIYCKDDQPCFGCNGASCKKSTAVNKQAPYFYLFDAMTGNSSLRCRFDGEQTKMHKLIGNNGGHDCGADFTVDFLFGYIGYDYRKCTDNSIFKDEIMSSINAGKPVIVKEKSGNPCFKVITGYNESTLLCPDYRIVIYKSGKNILSDKPEEAPTYEELECLYLIGEKTTPRYSLKDGIENIQRVMENNIDESIWDDGLAQIKGWSKFYNNTILEHTEIVEIKEHVERIKEMMNYKYNSWNFRMVFKDCCNKKLSQNNLYKDLCNPEFSALWKKINILCGSIVSNSHEMMKLGVDWNTVTPSDLIGISEKICEIIVKAKKDDIKMLGYIKQANKILTVNN